MNIQNAERPAILGGLPVRPEGPPTWPRTDPLVDAAIRNLLQTGDWGRYHGPHVPELCRRLAEYQNVEHVLPCSSGTAAVELALRGVGVAEKDEVILAGYDFKANFQNILCLRAVPVLVDLDPSTWQLDCEKLSTAITDRTKAILISHLHGGFVDAPKVRQIADASGIPVIEDICQCPGAMLYGRRAGNWGDASVLSFGGSKLLTAGRGGAVITPRTDIAERIKRYVHRGNDAYPLSEAQAAIVRPQIDQLDYLNGCRRESVEKLISKLSDNSGLKALQTPNENLLSTYYKVGFQYLGTDFHGMPRSLFVASIQAEGIAFDTGFRGLHLIHASRRFVAADELIQASRADAEMLTLHHPVLLEGAEAIDALVAAVEKVRKCADEIQSAHLTQ